jgi:hypothetical protein
MEHSACSLFSHITLAQGRLDRTSSELRDSKNLSSGLANGLPVQQLDKLQLTK